MDYRWYKKMPYDKKVELGYLRTLSQGTMPITKVCKDDDEYDAFQEAKKGMRGLKTINFEIEEK